MGRHKKIQIEKVISLYDIHFPYNINLEGIYKFLDDEQPTTIILGGDQLDLYSISKYYIGDFESGLYLTQSEIAGFKKILEKIKKICPNSKIIRLDGNHEDRVYSLLQQNHGRGQLLDYKIIYKGLVDKFLRYNEFYKIGKIYYTHGIYHNDNHSKKHVLQTQRNVIYGHLHTIQTYTLSSPIDEEVHVGKSVPCLCNINPDYMRNKPSSWLNGFHIAYIQPNGNFNDYIITINNGKFYFNGKLYQ